MPIEINGITFFTPAETAKRLGISLGMLRYLRIDGRVEGTQIGNTHFYTEEQIQKANITPKKRGPNRDKASLMLVENEKLAGAAA
jgi:hypothetical protein